MPFQPGQGGRPRGARNRVSRQVGDAFLKLGGPNGQQYAKQLHELATGKHDDPHVRIKALAIIAPYVWGKPTEHVEVAGEGGGPVQIRFVDAA